MIREMLEARKKNQALKGNPLNQEVQHLSLKLKNIRKEQPTIKIDSARFSVDAIKDLSPLRPQEIIKQIKNQKVKSKPSPVKCKINWNNSATIMTRERSPSHKIPQAKRFQGQKNNKDWIPELELNIATNLMDKTGVSFARANRKQLWKPDLITPSPQQYNLKRYLENKSEHLRSYISYACPQNQEIEHIKGGSIGKFFRYENLYYPHVKKLDYNQKIITEKHNQKSRSLPHSKVFQSL